MSLQMRLQQTARLQSIYAAYGEMAGVDPSFHLDSTSSTISAPGTKSRFLKDHTSFRVIAFLNGTLTNPVTVVAHSLQDVLDICTAKFNMNFAARRLFNREGQDLKNDIDLALLGRDAQVFVSAGEPFRDPIAASRARLLRVEQATRRAWGNPGSVQSSSHASNSSRRSLRAERIQALLAEARPRVLVFRNGDGRHGVQVVQGEQGKFTEDCAARLKLPAKVKLIFDLGGHELTAVPTALCDQSLFWLLGRVVGPVWASTGAPFSLDGPSAFLRELKVRLQARRRAVRERLAKVADGEGAAGEGLESTRRLDHLLDIDKMAWYQLRAHNDQLSATLSYLEAAQEQLSALEEETESRIPAIAAESHVLARPAMRFKVLANGTPLYRPDGASNARVISFDVAAASRGIPNGISAPLVFDRLLDSVTQALGLPSKARRLFVDTGVEVTTIVGLARDAVVFASMGEPFVSQIRIVLEAPLPSSDAFAPAPATSASASSQALPLSCLAVAEGAATTPYTKWLLARAGDDLAAAVLSCTAHPLLVLTAKGAEAVLLPPVAPLSPEQQWVFSATGTIAPRSDPTLLLTMVPPETQGDLREGVHLGLRLQAAAGRGGAAARTQLWGIKQDNFSLIGQWRLPGNPRALAKEALLWPTQATGDWNPRLAWPVDGMLVAGVSWDEAPADPSATAAAAATQPVLRVLVNGERDKSKAATIRVPRVVRSAKPLPMDTVQWLSKRPASTATSGQATEADAVSPSEQQRLSFLEDCARELHMTKAPKVLFTEAGAVVTDLSQLAPNDLVFVSCGEAFMRGANNKELQALHSYSARAFVTNLGLEAQALGGASLSAASVGAGEGAEGAEHVKANGDTARQWNVSLVTDPDSRWVLTDTRHIQLVGQPGVVLEASALTPGAAVRMGTLNDAEIRQKWVADAAGFIQSAMDATLVLAVRDCGLTGSGVVLAHKLPACNAQQMWRFEAADDAGGSVLTAYAASPRVLALTAAVHSRLCTTAVAGPEPVLQLVGAAGAPPVCLGCRGVGEVAAEHGAEGGVGRAVKFVCSRSASHLAGWPTMDPAAALVPLGARVRVDTLSNCSAAIARWTAEEQRLQPSAAPAQAVRSISNDAVRTYRVRVFKNGVFDERKAAVVLLPGASSPAIQAELLMQEATRRLNLTSAGRALYTAAGRQVTSMDLKAPDLRPDDEGLLPPLWLSAGEPFIDPSKEQRLRECKHEYRDLKKTLRDLCDRLAAAADAVDKDSAHEASLLEQLQSGRARLTQLQAEIDKLAGRAAISDESRLVQGGRAARVRVRRNGLAAGPWKVCWGRTLEELLATCSEHLGFGVRKLYNARGLPVVSISELRVDQHLYASAGEPFYDAKEVQQQIKSRAEFAQALKAQKSSTAK